MTLKYISRYRLLSLFFVSFLVSAEVTPELARESLVRVRAYNNNQVVAEGTGFVVNKEGHVLTNAHFIDHDEISREHTRLTYTNDRLYAEDLDTLNGTSVNGNALQPREKALLQDKDRLQMRPLILTVRLAKAGGGQFVGGGGSFTATILLALADT